MSTETSPMGLFERYLSFWVGLCIAAGVGLGLVVPGAFQAIARLEYASVNLVVAVFIWVMIYPMRWGYGDGLMELLNELKEAFPDIIRDRLLSFSLR